MKAMSVTLSEGKGRGSGPEFRRGSTSLPLTSTNVQWSPVR